MRRDIEVDRGCGVFVGLEGFDRRAEWCRQPRQHVLGWIPRDQFAGREVIGLAIETSRGYWSPNNGVLMTSLLTHL